MLIYYTVDISRISKLRENLQSELFNSSNSAGLLCENNQNRTVPCPNGFCQLINDGESNFTRNCISEGISSFPPSILVGSSMVEEFEKKSPFMYTCNQHMCNNLQMAQRIQELLEQHGLLTPINRHPIDALETTTTSSDSFGVRMIPQTIIGIQWVVLFILTLSFRKI